MLLLKLTTLETAGTNVFQLKGCCFCVAAIALRLPEARIKLKNALLLRKLSIKRFVQSTECFDKRWIHVWNGKEIKIESRLIRWTTWHANK